MKKVNFNEALGQILKDDPRYDEQAYLFLREALDFTIKLFAKPIGGPGRHVVFLATKGAAPRGDQMRPSLRRPPHGPRRAGRPR